MANYKRQVITVTTDASGDATQYSAVINGEVDYIQYVKVDFADGVDFTITCELTGTQLWAESNVNASKLVRPTVLTDLQDGTAHTVRDSIRLFNDRVKIVVAQGGVSKTGTFHIATK